MTVERGTRMLFTSYVINIFLFLSLHNSYPFMFIYSRHRTIVLSMDLR